MPWLINCAQLDKFRKSQKNILVFDASFHLPNDGRDAKQEFVEGHIAGAHFFPIDAFSDRSPTSPHPHMVNLQLETIADTLATLGVRNDSKIIFYDNSKLHSACRAVWMLKIFGHNPQLLYVLDGTLDTWKQYGGKIETGETTITPRSYQVNLKTEGLRMLSQMKSNAHNPTEQVVDVRHAVRFAGGPETRDDVRLGHIPGSFSFPYVTLFEKNGQWRPIDKIRQQLIGVGIDFKSPIVSTCGSGITAPTLDFVLDLLEHPQHAVYNGSWNEWGAKKTYANELSSDERPVISSLEIEP